jgi:hypothetical protein
VQKVEVIRTKTDTAYKTHIDTVNALTEFLNKNVYKDTIYLPDSLGSVQITDTIYRNQLQYRNYIASITERTFINVITITKPPTSALYTGPSVGLSAGVPTIGGELMYMYRGKQYYKLGAGIDLKSNTYLNFTYGVKIVGK